MGPEPAGMQPFSSPDGSAVVCNGELYGFRRLKKTLEAKGYVFRSGSDCELILPLWRVRRGDVPDAGRGVCHDPL
jgi:asparagine synthase (glutamine-hydrolysing)